jgi:hypothetical protein
MKVTTMILPTHWASAFVNGDLTGYESDDLEAIRMFTDDMVHEYGRCWCIDVTDDEGFLRYHDAQPYNVLACDCSTFVFDITQ